MCSFGKSTALPSSFPVYLPDCLVQGWAIFLRNFCHMRNLGGCRWPDQYAQLSSAQYILYISINGTLQSYNENVEHTIIPVANEHSQKHF